MILIDLDRGGRVKTLHPAVHGGILSTNSESDNVSLSEIIMPSLDGSNGVSEIAAVYDAMLSSLRF